MKETWEISLHKDSFFKNKYRNIYARTDISKNFLNQQTRILTLSPLEYHQGYLQY